MRKWLLLLIALLLAGCGSRATPTPSPTPRPTAIPTKTLNYYPTVEPEILNLLVSAFGEYKKIPSFQEVNGEKSLVVWPLISTGKTETIYLREKNVELDVIWVIDYNHIMTPIQFPYVYGVWFQGGTYYLFANSPSSQPLIANRDEVKILETLPKGIPFLVRIGSFVEPGKVDWERCNYPDDLCDLGSYYSQEIDFGVTQFFISRSAQRIPDWWFLYGWLFDNLGTSIRVNLP